MMRWRCRGYRPLLVDAADDGLAPVQRQRLDRHLEQCDRCRGDLEALRALSARLRTSTVPDPGEGFWTQQRRAIAHSIRQLPASRPRRAIDRLREVWEHSAWRYPIAVAASLVVALGVYRSAMQMPAADRGGSDLAALDTDVMLDLRDLMHVLVPGDDFVPQVSGRDEAQLARLPLAEFVGMHASPAVPVAGELSEFEIEGIGDLVGDMS